MAHTSVLQGRKNEKPNSGSMVQDSILSDSKNVIQSSNMEECQQSHNINNNNASDHRKQKRRKNRRWSHRRLKRTKSSREITRAVYPVSYQYMLGDFMQNEETGKFSSKHSIEVAPTASETTVSYSRKVLLSGNPIEPEGSQYKNTVPSFRKQKSQKNHEWTTNAPCTQRAKSVKQDGNATSNGYDCWVDDHTYSVRSRYVVPSKSATSCSTLTTDKETSTKEKPLRIPVHPPCLEERAESVPSVDLHLLVVDPSPACDKDASLVSDQSAERDDADIDNDAEIDDDVQIDGDADINSGVPVLSDSVKETDSGNPSFWDELESSLRPVIPFPWMTRASGDKLSLMRIPVRNNLAVQIGITIDAFDTYYFVHNKPLPSKHEVRTHRARIGTLTLREAVETVVKVVAAINTMKVCPGARDYEEFWNKITDGVVEENSFLENESKCKVLRSQNCNLLIRGVSACVECKKIACRLRRFKSNSINRPPSQNPPSKFSPNQCLSSEQQLRKLADLQRLVKLQSKKIARLTKKEEL